MPAEDYASEHDVRESFTDLPELDRAGAIEAATLLCDAMHESHDLSWSRACLAVKKCLAFPQAFKWLETNGLSESDTEKFKRLLKPAQLIGDETPVLETEE